MERDTTTVTTPVGNHTIVLKQWLTAREQRSIRAVYLNDLKVSQNDKGENEADYIISGGMLEKAQDAAITAVVASVNGETEGCLEKILDMRDADYQFIVAEINKITGGTSEEDKKK